MMDFTIKIMNNTFTTAENITTYFFSVDMLKEQPKVMNKDQDR